jgi:DNA-binding transcriptional LysR family regulator
LKAPHALLESGEVDLALGTFTRVIVGCRQKLLYRERYVCVVRRDHPEFAQGMTTEAFHRVSHAVGDPRGYVHEKLDSWLAEQGVSRRAKLYVPYLLSLPLVIAQTDLMAIMASKVAERFATMIPLKVMVPPISLPAYDVRLFWHERFDNDPANKWLRSICIRLFKA